MYQVQRTQSNNQTGKSLTLVNREAVEGLKVPGFDHQTTPFIERSLMANRNSIVRIIPGVADDGTILGTLKEGFDPKDATKDFAACLSDTFCVAGTIQPFGSQWRDTVLTAYPPNSPEEQDRINMGQASVLEKFARVVAYCTDTQKKGRRPMQAHPDWFRWTGLKGGTLGKVKYRFMFQAVIYNASDRYFEVTDQATGKTSNKPMVGLVGIDQGASVQEFMEALVIPRDISKPADPFTNSNLGPVAEANGIWCFIHSESTPNDASGAKFKLFPRYYPVGKDPMTPPSKYPLSEEWIRATWQPWNKLLRWYTKEEQFYLIADTFGPDTVNYFFESLGEDCYTAFVPSDIRRKGYGRYAGMMGRGQAVHANYGAPAPGVPDISVPAGVPEAPKVEESIPMDFPVPPQDIVMPDAVSEPAKEDTSGIDPRVRQLMQEAVAQGVRVTNAPGDPFGGDLGLPPVPGIDDGKIDLDDIVPNPED